MYNVVRGVRREKAGLRFQQVDCIASPTVPAVPRSGGQGLKCQSVNKGQNCNWI